MVYGIGAHFAAAEDKGSRQHMEGPTLLTTKIRTIQAKLASVFHPLLCAQM